MGGRGPYQIDCLAQCRGDISRIGCSKCFSEERKQFLQNCHWAVGGQIFVDICFLRYDNCTFGLQHSNVHISILLIFQPPIRFRSLPAIVPRPGAGRHTMVLIVVVIGATVVVFVLLIFSLFLWRKNTGMSSKYRKPMHLQDQHQTEDDWSGSHVNGKAGIIYFDYEALKKATGNFCEQNKLGEGGFGPVYKGKLPTGILIAVKKLSVGVSIQGKAEFLSELKILRNIQHRNLVRLIGCCSQGREFLLVYEYMKNRSLDQHLFGRSGVELNWKLRYGIIFGIARGLAYLHEDFHVRIIHRDIKASNILLDDKIQPKIADFGLARLFPDDQTHVSTTLAGTFGYTAPEYLIHGQLTEKADIYSYGVLVLEIVSGRTNTDLKLPANKQYLLEWAWRLYEKGRPLDIVDRTMGPGIGTAELLRAIIVAFLCIQSAEHRPPMSRVVAMLLSIDCEMLIGKPILKPAFIDMAHKSTPETLTPFTSSVHNLKGMNETIGMAKITTSGNEGTEIVIS